MGIIHNHALIVNAGDTQRLHDSVYKVKHYASQFGSLGETDSFNNLIVIVPSVVNFTVTVFMAPDGSKEGWVSSLNGDKIREYFIEEMSKYGEVIEVQWGEYGNKMVEH